MPDAALTLFDPRNGDLSLRIAALEGDLSQPQRSNYFTLYWIQEGHGTFWADLGQHPFASGAVLCFIPYQCLRLLPETSVRGLVLQFHANFFCLEANHAEVGCNGVLFNDVYGIPSVQLDAAQEQEFATLVADMRRELEASGLAHTELLIAYLKILLIKATRLKVAQQALTPEKPPRYPPILDELKQLIETHYRKRHSPSDYDDLLPMTPKALGKIVKAHLGKTLTELIRERLLKQAKWELLHTLKPVKQIATELGFADEFYFSRLFKQATGCAPTFFREFETAIRGGSNLSRE